MSDACTEERFRRDVAGHKVIVLRDDGVNRHIRLKKPGTVNMYFDLITWPGYLCYTGDMGTYVFQRTEDMFRFFRRRGRLDGIDHHYWAEKVEAACRGDIREFNYAKFQAMIRQWVANHEQEHEPDDDDEAMAAKHAAAYAELRAAVEDDVVNCDENDVRCFDAATDFTHSGDAWKEYHGDEAQFEFADLWDGFDYATKEFTFRFLWCCYALAWGIEQYDAHRSAAQSQVLDEGIAAAFRMEAA